MAFLTVSALVHRQFCVYALTLACLCNPASITGQATTSPVPGSRLRLTAPTYQLDGAIGTLQSADSTTLVVWFSGSQSPQPIARSAIDRLDVSIGTKSQAGRGAVIGILAGGISVGGMALSAAQAEYTCSGCTPYILLATGLGMAVGALVGAIIGSVLHSDMWSPMVWEEGSRTILFYHRMRRLVPK